MTAPTEEQLIETLNKLDDEFIYTISEWCFYHKGRKRPSISKRPLQWWKILRKGIIATSIEDTEEDTEDTEDTTHVKHYIIEIEKDFVCLGRHQHRNVFFRYDDSITIEQMASKIINNIKRKEGIKGMF